MKYKSNFYFTEYLLEQEKKGRYITAFVFAFSASYSLITLTVFQYRQVQKTTGNMDTALWLTAITFLTVGYGDVSPDTSCGKVVCLFTGLMVRNLRRDTQHLSG